MKNNLFSILVRRREKRSQSNKAARPQGQRAANWFQMDTAGGSKKSNTAEMKINTRFCEVSPDIYQKKKKRNILGLPSWHDAHFKFFFFLMF